MDFDKIKQQIIDEGLRPEDCHFSKEGVIVGSSFHASGNPRLDFARVLAMWKQPKNSDAMFGVWSSVVTKGENVEIGHGCCIGGHGFGYEFDEEGRLIDMPHHGRVVIEDDVTIHNNVCIDRAVLGETRIGRGTKIDNLVHVAHNVKIGKYCLVVAGAVFGGSCEIGDRTFIGGNVFIKQHVKVGRNCVIGAGAVVTHDVPDGEIWVGNPARFLKKTEERRFKV